MGFTSDESDTLVILNIVASSFSFSGSLFIIFMYLKCAELRTFAFRMVFLVALSDLFYSIANFLGDQGGDNGEHSNSSGCQFQAILISYTELCSLFWSVCIAFTLHQGVLRNRPLMQLQTYMSRYCLVAYGLPVLLTVLPLTTDSYGDADGWCWIEDDDTSTAWRFITWYGILWICLIYTVYVYVRVNRRFSEVRGEEGEASGSLKKNQIVYYPLVLFICWFWASANRLYQIFGDGHLWLSGLHVFFASLTGFGNFIVFGTTPVVRASLFRILPCLHTHCLCCRPEMMGDELHDNEEMSEYPSDGSLARDSEGEARGDDSMSPSAMDNVSLAAAVEEGAGPGGDSRGWRGSDGERERGRRQGSGNQGSISDSDAEEENDADEVEVELGGGGEGSIR